MTRGASILVVDDHPTNRLVLVSLIRRHGYEALEAGDGDEALHLVRSERPALVISDILMPTVDGFEFVRRLRADPEVAGTRVIFCTATYREREAEELARIGGVYRVLSKPCQPTEMLDAIEGALTGEPAPATLEMAHAFDREHVRLMTDKLSAQEAALSRAQRVARLAHLITRPDGSFDSWSEMLPEITGIADASMPRSAREWLERVHSDHREGLRTKMVTAARYGLRAEAEYPFLRGDGNWMVVSQVMEPMATGGSSPDPRWFSTLQDVTAQKRAEEEVLRLNRDLERLVRERTAELEAAMKELEAFDYSISHDLRGPINRIRGFATALTEDHAGQLDAAGMDLLRRVCDAGERMEQLVADLFSLSTVSRGELRRSDVDVSAVAESVARALARAHPERQVAFDIEPGMRESADAGLLRIVFENLIGNAWKFTRRRPDARIQVGSEAGGASGRVYFVRDNGAGFEPEQAAHLFAPFRRLHSASDYEGTGIGLATVARIVGRHGGRAWAEGTPGVGATMRFTLSP
ncbi:MAG TPA: response regulator [Usitatibacter sp.]|nr:response regulator [Usitatibacter sp.]